MDTNGGGGVGAFEGTIEAVGIQRSTPPREQLRLSGGGINSDEGELTTKERITRALERATLNGVNSKINYSDEGELMTTEERITKALKIATANARETLQNIERQMVVQLTVRTSQDTFTFNATDLERLKPGEWYNDQIINAYAQLVADAFDHVAVASSFLFTSKKARINYEIKQGPFFSPPRSPKNVNIIYVPVNLMDNHWAVIAMDKRSHKIHFLDSLQVGTTNTVKGEYCDNLREYMSTACTDFIGNEPWTVVSTQQCCLQQLNTNDCGPFVCYFMFAIALATRQQKTRTFESILEDDPRVFYDVMSSSRVTCNEIGAIFRSHVDASLRASQLSMHY